MFITEDDKERRLEQSEQLFSSLSIERINRGRGNSSNVPEFLRPIIGASVFLSGEKATREAFGLKSTAGTWSAKTGRTTPLGPVSEERVSQIENIIGTAQEKAAEKLVQALGLITPEKMEGTKARDLSGIAADMSRILEKTSPKSNSFAGANIVIYAPNQRKEESYDVIELGKKNVQD